MTVSSRAPNPEALYAHCGDASPDEVVPGGTIRQFFTVDFVPCGDSSLDPLVEEVTWTARELVGVRSFENSHDRLDAVRGGFRYLLEMAWQPGRSLILSELAVVPDDDGDVRLRARVGVAMFGPRASTGAEVSGITPALDELVDSPRMPFHASPIDPAVLLGGPSEYCGENGTQHRALIRQRMVSVGTRSDRVEILSRFHPPIDPWMSIATRLLRWGRPITVRATMLGTTLSPQDHMELDEAASRLSFMRAPTGDIRGEGVAQLDRALHTVLDLQASFDSPLFVGEIAVIGAEPLPESMLRTIAVAFTSETNVHRGQGTVVVAGQPLLLGGFEIERDPPQLADALRSGLPLRGGLVRRELVDLMTLTEAPTAWPAPTGDGIPGVPPAPPAPRPVPNVLRAELGSAASTVLGRSDRAVDVGLPLDLRPLHTLVTGTWGSGKSTVLTRLALDDLRHGRPFLFIDPHGSAADWLCGWGHHLGVAVATLDAQDGRSAAIRPFPKLRRDGQNRAAVEDAIAQFADAVASSLLDAEWAGPRWQATIRSMLEVGAAHGAELSDLVTWLNDADELRSHLAHPAISPLARSTLANLTRGGHDADAVRGWASSKLHPVVSGPARRLLAAPGGGLDLASLVNSGTAVILNLGALSTSEAELVGHLVLAQVLDAAMRRTPDARSLFTCYVDEAHRFPVRGLTRVLAEGRKFGVGLVAATQALSQLDGKLADLAQGVATTIAFRATPDTAMRLSSLIDATPNELATLPDLQCVVSVAGVGAVAIDVPPYESCPTPYEKRPPRATRRRRQARTAMTKEPGLSVRAPSGSPIIDDWLATRSASTTAREP